MDFDLGRVVEKFRLLERRLGLEKTVKSDSGFATESSLKTLCMIMGLVRGWSYYHGLDVTQS